MFVDLYGAAVRRTAVEAVTSEGRGVRVSLSGGQALFIPDREVSEVLQLLTSDETDSTAACYCRRVGNCSQETT